MTTIVAKLFHIIEPETAFFGQKDAAQIAVIRRMVRDLNFPVQIVVCPIVRESDGLAMSSRNAYLNPEERVRALVLRRSLQEVQQRFEGGERVAAKLISAAKRAFAREPQVRLEYFEVVDPDTLDPVERITQTTLVAVAAYVASDPGYRPFLDGLKGLVGPLLPRFDAEGKSYLTIAIGCTGGRHRSVAIAEELADWLRGAGRSVTLSHRDAEVAGEAGGAGADG